MINHHEKKLKNCFSVFVPIECRWGTKLRVQYGFYSGNASKVSDFGMKGYLIKRLGGWYLRNKNLRSLSKSSKLLNTPQLQSTHYLDKVNNKHLIPKYLIISNPKTFIIKIVGT